jgi:hypothetical protein
VAKVHQKPIIIDTFFEGALSLKLLLPEFISTAAVTTVAPSSSSSEMKEKQPGYPFRCLKGPTKSNTTSLFKLLSSLTFFGYICSFVLLKNKK